MVIYILCFFCCEDDDKYSNTSTSPPLPTTIVRLGYHISRHCPIPSLEARLTYYHQNDQLRAAALITPVSQESHRIMLGRQVRLLQPLSTADLTNDVHPPRLTSPPFDVSLRRFLAPRYATVYNTLHPDVFAQIHVLVLFKIQVLRTQYLMPSMASRLRPLKTRKR